VPQLTERLEEAICQFMDRAAGVKKKSRETEGP